GLANMSSRARRHSGWVDAFNLDPGTMISWRVTLPPARGGAPAALLPGAGACGAQCRYLRGALPPRNLPEHCPGGLARLLGDPQLLGELPVGASLADQLHDAAVALRQLQLVLVAARGPHAAAAVDGQDRLDDLLGAR